MPKEPYIVTRQRFGRIEFVRVAPLGEGCVDAALMIFINLSINAIILVLNILIFLIVTVFTGSKGARIASISVLVVITLIVVLIVRSYSVSSNMAGYSPATGNSQQAMFDQTATANPTSFAPVTNTNSATSSVPSTTTHVPVNSNIPPPGVDTGIAVTSGEKVTVTASGWITYGTNPDGTCDGTPPVNPDGQRQYPNGGLSCPPLIDPYTIAQNVPVGEILAGVFPSGTSGTPGGFSAVGSHGSFIAQGSGHLYLLVNESTYNNNGGWTDNVGSYQATVTITPA